VKDTAKLLYGIYIVFTLAEMMLLKLTGLSLYESSIVSFSTVGTGGFGVMASSCATYPLASRIVIIIFMTLCGINFSVYYFLLTKRFKEAWQCDEMRWYLIVMFVSSVVMAWNTIRAGIFAGFGEAFQHTLFTVSSIMTTTGFASIDYNEWPQFSRTLIIILTFIGACAGCTGGGFKYSRAVILFRNAKNEVMRTIHPKSVRKVYMDGHVVEDDTVRTTNAYLAIYVIIFIVSFLMVAFFESITKVDMDRFDFETNLTAVATTLNNVGPGLNVVGPAGGFHDFTWASKMVLIFDMLAGRLELMPILILFSRNTWKDGSHRFFKDSLKQHSH
jgi:trk system potassium uptake protein TrkH